MNKLEPYKGIELMITEVIPTLEKDGVVYAHLVRAEDKNGTSYSFRERNSLPINDYVGKPLECILEITACDFFQPESSEEKTPKGVESVEYLWAHSGYKFIPELLELIEGHQDIPDYDYDEDEYDRIGGDLFKAWGVTGLGLDIYQDKPMIKTDSGVLLVNLEMHEEIIEEWVFGQRIHFRYIDGLLRGFKLYEGDWKVKPKLNKYGFEEKPGEFYIVGKPKFIDNWEDDSISKRVKDGFKKIFGD